MAGVHFFQCHAGSHDGAAGALHRSGRCCGSDVPRPQGRAGRKTPLVGRALRLRHHDARTSPGRDESVSARRLGRSAVPDRVPDPADGFCCAAGHDVRGSAAVLPGRLVLDRWTRREPAGNGRLGSLQALRDRLVGCRRRRCTRVVDQADSTRLGRRRGIGRHCRRVGVQLPRGVRRRHQPPDPAGADPRVGRIGPAGGISICRSRRNTRDGPVPRSRRNGLHALSRIRRVRSDSDGLGCRKYLPHAPRTRGKPHWDPSSGSP